MHGPTIPQSPAFKATAILILVFTVDGQGTERDLRFLGDHSDIGGLAEKGGRSLAVLMEDGLGSSGGVCHDCVPALACVINRSHNYGQIPAWGEPTWLRKDEVNVRSIAGNEVSIFLFRFDLRGDGIDFVLNEAIAADMYQDVDEKMRPLVHACCETLLRYKHLSVSNTIMDGNILATGGFEVMLSKGLGSHFAPDEKARLFQDAKTIHDLLAAVMDRRTQDPKKGKKRGSAPIKSPPSLKKINKGLEELGKAKRLQENSRWLEEGRQIRPGIRQLRPDELPPDVTVSSGYDHRGQCYVFGHKKYGDLGKIVLVKVGEQKMLIQAEIYKGQEEQDSTTAKKKRAIFEKVVGTVNACFNENFPSSVS